MAKIVLINSDSYRSGINEINDITEFHDDNVGLSGAGYQNFRVITVQNITAAQIRAKQDENWPECRFDDSGVRYWLNPEDSLWYRIQVMTKYRFSVKDLSQQDMSKLQQSNVTAEEKLAIIGSIPAKFTTVAGNNTTTEYYLWDTGDLG